MAKTLSIEFNVKDFVKSLDTDLKAAEKQLDKIMEGEFSLAVANAARIAPVDEGILRSSIKSKSIAPLNHELFAREFYAVYQEFGTGKNVVIPPPFKPTDDAIPIDYNVIAREAADDAKARMPSKGIRKMGAAFMGIRPRPFLVPSFEDAIKRIILTFNKLKL